MPESTRLIVVDNPARWRLHVPAVEVVAARTYMADPRYAALSKPKVFNLCRSFRYQSTGYYVSLLASARGHRVLPSVATIQDLRLTSMMRLAGEELQEMIDIALRPLKSDRFELSVYFGRNMAARYDQLSAALFDAYPAPLLRASFLRRDDIWELTGVRLIGAHEVPESHHAFVIEQTQRYFERSSPRRRKSNGHRYDIAILINPQDATPPSNEKALAAFEEAAEHMGMRPQRIGPQDYGRIAEYDALFLRETTAVDHHTFRFARRAAAEGLIVIDDPLSILRCTNKVFLAELLQRHRITVPRSVIFSRENADTVAVQIGFPCVVKVPDSSFSMGVRKLDSPETFDQALEQMFEDTDLLLAQEFVPTDYDWRIGVLGGQPLYAAKYFMARSHWQIYNHSKQGDDATGNAETVPVHSAPQRIVKAAVRAASLMGEGLYGVDVKDVNGKPYIIEVNDNPSIDAGVEDQVLGPQLYLSIMRHFVHQLDYRPR
ncbi:MAG: RimK family protein [Phycisphaeraceae bacterium]|nr:RimK family protein [Phycisphaeraceae bacterium]